jgi:hypothetical protein
MPGHYSGLQAGLKEQHKYALYAPCVGHSTNLLGVQAVDCNLNVTIYFDFVQNLYNFFSSSAHRWEILVSHLGPNLKVVKHLSKTRWSAHADAVTALNDGYEEITKSLDALLNEINQSLETRLIAQSSRKKTDELETMFFAVLWNGILIRINSASKVLQKQNINLSVTVKLIKPLMAYVSEKKDCFDDYQDAYKRVRQCSSTTVLLDGGRHTDELQFFWTVGDILMNYFRAAGNINL